MLPLIISRTRSWNFAWHLQPRAKILSNSWQQAKPFTPCAARTIIFQRENLNYLIVCCTQRTLFFPKFVFYCIADLFAVHYLWVVCNEDKCCVVTQRTADIRVAWLVYVRMYCVPIATLNQNKRSQKLFLEDAQMWKNYCAFVIHCVCHRLKWTNCPPGIRDVPLWSTPSIGWTQFQMASRLLCGNQTKAHAILSFPSWWWLKLSSSTRSNSN